MSKNYKVTVNKSEIIGSSRVYNYYAEISITDGKREALFIQHGEAKINGYKFSKGKTENGVKLWTKHDKNFNSDFNFIKIGYCGKKQNKITEFSDMLSFINECNGLPVIYPKCAGTTTYEIKDEKIINVVTDDDRNLFDTVYASIEKYESSKEMGFPKYYVEKLKGNSDKIFKEVVNKNLENEFYNYMTNKMK